jgi:hypothetical protein
VGEKEGRDVPPLPRMSFGYLGMVVCQYVPGRKSSSSLLSLLLLLLLPCSVLLLLACHCTGAGVLLRVAIAFFLFLLRPSAAECYIWDSIFLAMFRSVALLLRSDQVIIIISRRQTGLQMARSGCREARGHHHLPAGFGFLRPPVCQLSCCQSSCP